jgi:Universal stress protein family
MFKRILVPTDGSARSDHAARAAIELARFLDASIVALYVYYPLRVIAAEPFVAEPAMIPEKAYVKGQQRHQSSGEGSECALHVAVRGARKHRRCHRRSRLVAGRAVRPDLHRLARSQPFLANDPRQRDHQGAGDVRGPRAGVSRSARIRHGQRG